MKSFDPYSRTNQLIIDGFIYAISFALAFLIRFQSLLNWIIIRQCLIWMPYLIAVRLIVNWRSGIYRFIWRYVSLPDVVAIARSLMWVSLGLTVLRVVYPGTTIYGNHIRLSLIVISLEYMMSLMGMISARALRRILYERGKLSPYVSSEPSKRVVLYGAGSAGITLLKELNNHPEVETVGFIDDDPKKAGAVVGGARVLGDGKALRRIVRGSKVDEVVVSIAGVEHNALKRILTACDAASVPAKIIPSVRELFQGHVNITQLRQLKMEDLLGRETSETSEFDEGVREMYAGKRILVTGAGGSIGSELVRQLLTLGPAALAMLDKDENSTYELQQELASRFPEATVEPQIADVRHADRLSALFGEFKPEIVFHAAAHKHVPLMERHPCEAVLNNVLGTKTVLEICRRLNVDRFVFISTDKAVSPTSIMGATKRLGELLVRSYSEQGSLASACVRFGNVMGSRGSVIPLFQKQILEGGPVTVTHPDVVRFFMTIPEAVQLVISAGAMGKKGEIYVMDMGNPRRVLDLAKEMVQLAGLDPERDIEIAITGLRPGEKLVEELVGPNENAISTRFEKLSMVVPQAMESDGVLAGVGNLIQAAQQNDSSGIHEILSRMNIGFSSHSAGSRIFGGAK